MLLSIATRRAVTLMAVPSTVQDVHHSRHGAFSPVISGRLLDSIAIQPQLRCSLVYLACLQWLQQCYVRVTLNAGSKSNRVTGTGSLHVPLRLRRGLPARAAAGWTVFRAGGTTQIQLCLLIQRRCIWRAEHALPTVVTMFKRTWPRPCLKAGMRRQIPRGKYTTLTASSAKLLGHIQGKHMIPAHASQATQVLSSNCRKTK